MNLLNPTEHIALAEWIKIINVAPQLIWIQDLAWFVLLKKINIEIFGDRFGSQNSSFWNEDVPYCRRCLSKRKNPKSISGF